MRKTVYEWRFEILDEFNDLDDVLFLNNLNEVKDRTWIYNYKHELALVKTIWNIDHEYGIEEKIFESYYYIKSKVFDDEEFTIPKKYINQFKKYY